jgi:amidase
MIIILRTLKQVICSIILLPIMFASIRFLLYSLCPAWAPRRTLDLLTATASDIELQLNAGSITSRQLVTQYFEQIGKYDGYLKAVLVKSPEALRQADALDEERRAGLVRGPLHGIPVLLKVCNLIEKSFGGTFLK